MEKHTGPFTFGIEHEVAFWRKTGEFADFLSTSFAEFAAIIEHLPVYQEDYPQLRLGRTGVRAKRWYIEGFDRYDETGTWVRSQPKGIEIRTTPQPTIQQAFDELVASFHQLRLVARDAGFFPVLTSFHPFRTTFEPDVSWNAFESQRLAEHPGDQAALFAMLTYGPDLNLSYEALDPEAVIDIGCKYLFYSPYLLPFSYSSPFYAGRLWEGLSVRTYLRVEQRPILNVFLIQADVPGADYPSFVKSARLPSEHGRIEFKACDSCGDFRIYAGLLALFKGLLLDTTLQGRALVPDRALHQLAARQGFASATIVAGAQMLLDAVEQALRLDADLRWLLPLQEMLSERTTPAHQLLQRFMLTQSIEESVLYASEP